MKSLKAILYGMVVLISWSAMAQELERDWFTPDLNLPDSWNLSIHASEGIDCHGCHVESETADVKTVAWLGNQSITVTLLGREAYDARCESCHNEETQTFQITFHGKHAALGKTNIPTCSYCHAGHELPLDSVENPLHPTRIDSICAGCHSDGNTNIRASLLGNAGGTSIIKMHQQPESLWPLKLGLSSWINAFYFLMVLGLLTFSIFYIFTDIPVLFSGSRENIPQSQSLNGTTRWLHIVFSVSFVALAITGFAIKYSESTFSHSVMYILGDPDTRSVIHRIAAIFFVGSAYNYLVYAIIKRFNIRAMIPRRRDFELAIQSLRRRAGMPVNSPKPPNTINWVSKFEFWASFIGMHIVLVTGILMWFLEWTLAYLGFDILKYAQQIHGWEAILAVTSVVLVHGYLKVARPLFFTSKAISKGES